MYFRDSVTLAVQPQLQEDTLQSREWRFSSRGLKRAWCIFRVMVKVVDLYVFLYVKTYFPKCMGNIFYSRAAGSQDTLTLCAKPWYAPNPGSKEI